MSSLRKLNLLRRRHYTIDLFQAPFTKDEMKKKPELTEAEEEFRGFKLKQQQFQKDDGLPIFLKAGLRDKVLYYTTLGLAGLGLLGSFSYIIGYANGWYKVEQKEKSK